MGRPFAVALVLVGALIGLALLDGGRERTAARAPLAGAPPEPQERLPLDEADDASALGGGLVDCLSSISPPGSTPDSPPLTPSGVGEIAERVERLRELRFTGPIDVTFLDPSGINRRVSGLVRQGTDPQLLADQGQVLELLGALPPGSDLLDLVSESLDSQVLGLFVPETKELLVSKSGKPGAIEAITLAHELEHALADDALGLPVPERSRRGRGDRDLAALSLVEGDASLAMSLYAVRFIAASEQIALLGDPTLAAGQEGLEKLPYVIQAQLIFPYEAGLGYVCELYSRGGWDAVDRAYANPPRSTAELLDPAAGPIRVEDPAPVGRLTSPWRRALADGIGAAELSWLFEAPGDDPGAAIPDPAGAAADWRGGEVELWRNGEEAAVGISLSERPGGSLCGAMIAWYGAAFPGASLSADGAATTFEGPDGSATIACSPGGVRLGIGPDPEAAAALAG